MGCTSGLLADRMRGGMLPDGGPRPRPLTMYGFPLEWAIFRAMAGAVFRWDSSGRCIPLPTGVVPRLYPPNADCELDLVDMPDMVDTVDCGVESRSMGEKYEPLGYS